MHATTPCRNPPISPPLEGEIRRPEAIFLFGFQIIMSCVFPKPNALIYCPALSSLNQLAPIPSCNGPSVYSTVYRVVLYPVSSP